MIKLPTVTAYTIPEVAEIMHKTPEAIRKYIHSGKLRAQKVGRAWYVTEKTLTEFITGEKTDTTQKREEV